MLSKKAIPLPSASLYFSMYVQSISSQRFLFLGFFFFAAKT